MQKIILYTAVILVSFLIRVSAQEIKLEQPYQWKSKGNKGESYLMLKEEMLFPNKEEVYTIKSNETKIDGFGTLMNEISSEQFLGKTVKMSCNVKSENVNNWAGLWMRVDFYKSKVLAFDNMQSRSIKGTTDWTKYEIVLYVPQDATSIAYGVLLDGKGQVWFDKVKFEIVDDSTPETGITKGRNQGPISFEEKAKAIAIQIETITTYEKEELKKEVEAIEEKLAIGDITGEEAKKLKMDAATKRAKNIETRIAVEEQKLSQLVKDKVDGKVTFEKSKKGGTRVVFGGSPESLGENQTEINPFGLKIYNGRKDYINKVSKRTTSQVVFAMGLNNTITEGESLKESDFRVWGSHFYELGLTLNSRIFKNHNLLHAKYGLSLMYNNLRPTDNRYFEKLGNQTSLATSTVNLDESRFRNVFLVAPAHLEFDFSPKRTNKDGDSYFTSHKALRLGIGGYGGFRIKSKQIMKYEIDGNKVKNKEKGDFNVSDFTYGVSSYLGYGATSLYIKYDLNPMFKNNPINQNNISLGIRFDFN